MIVMENCIRFNQQNDGELAICFICGRLIVHTTLLTIQEQTFSVSQFLKIALLFNKFAFKCTHKLNLFHKKWFPLKLKKNRHTNVTESGLLQANIVLLSLLVLWKLYIVINILLDGICDMYNDCVNQKNISNNIESYGWFKMREKKTEGKKWKSLFCEMVNELDTNVAYWPLPTVHCLWPKQLR